jgi:hypothetical protein
MTKLNQSRSMADGTYNADWTNEKIRELNGRIERLEKALKEIMAIQIAGWNDSPTVSSATVFGRIVGMAKIAREALEDNNE